MRLSELLWQAFGARARVSCQSPIHLDDFSEPQPDLALLVRRDYGQRHPTAADTLLVIEVSETTLRYDRYTKLPLYARHGVPEVWIVDTAGNRLHTFRNPSGAAYSEAITIDELGPVSVMSFPDLTLDLSKLLP
jgi:Uma2 family endonuclease